MTKSKLKWVAESRKNPLEFGGALYEAALSEFSSHSYKEASLNDILKTAGMNKGSFYYRFYDKLDLYLSLAWKIGIDKLAFFEKYEDMEPPNGFFEGFRQKTVLGLRFAQTEPRYVAYWRRMLSEETDIRAAVSDCFGGVREGMLDALIDCAKTAGEIRTEVPTAMISQMLASLTERVDAVVLKSWDETQILNYIDAVLDIVRFGISSQSKLKR